VLELSLPQDGVSAGVTVNTRQKAAQEKYLEGRGKLSLCQRGKKEEAGRRSQGRVG